MISGELSWTNTGYSYADPMYGVGTTGLIPEGTPTYLAVRFDPGDGFRYGWLGVIRGGDSVPGAESNDLSLFAWGYQTEPGIRIRAGAVVPAPGSLALLAFGAAAGASRPRRKDC